MYILLLMSMHTIRYNRHCYPGKYRALTLTYEYSHVGGLTVVTKVVTFELYMSSRRPQL